MFTSFKEVAAKQAEKLKQAVEEVTSTPERKKELDPDELLHLKSENEALKARLREILDKSLTTPNNENEVRLQHLLEEKTAEYDKLVEKSRELMNRYQKLKSQGTASPASNAADKLTQTNSIASVELEDKLKKAHEEINLLKLELASKITKSDDTLLNEREAALAKELAELQNNYEEKLKEETQKSKALQEMFDSNMARSEKQLYDLKTELISKEANFKEDLSALQSKLDGLEKIMAEKATELQRNAELSAQANALVKKQEEEISKPQPNATSFESTFAELSIANSTIEKLTAKTNELDKSLSESIKRNAELERSLDQSKLLLEEADIKTTVLQTELENTRLELSESRKSNADHDLAYKNELKELRSQVEIVENNLVTQKNVFEAQLLLLQEQLSQKTKEAETNLQKVHEMELDLSKLSNTATSSEQENISELKSKVEQLTNLVREKENIIFGLEAKSEYEIDRVPEQHQIQDFDDVEERVNSRVLLDRYERKINRLTADLRDKTHLIILLQEELNRSTERDVSLRVDFDKIERKNLQVIQSLEAQLLESNFQLSETSDRETELIARLNQGNDQEDATKSHLAELNAKLQTKTNELTLALEKIRELETFTSSNQQQNTLEVDKLSIELQNKQQEVLSLQEKIQQMLCYPQAYELFLRVHCF